MEFGFEWWLGPPPIGGTQDELWEWQARRKQARIIDGTIVAGFLLAIVVAMIVAASSLDRGTSDEPGWADPGQLTVEVSPDDTSVMPTSVPNGHGGVVHFDSGGGH